MLLTWKPIMAVSIAKAIPSLLERTNLPPAFATCACFNRESDSVTVGAATLWATSGRPLSFNRESDSVTVGAEPVRLAARKLGSFNRESDSVTVGAWLGMKQRCYNENVSIAKAIPSLLELERRDRTL